MSKKVNHERVIEDIEKYLKLLQYTYTLGGPMYISHCSLIQSIRDYIDFAKAKQF